jgi:hypothetical protein
MYVDDHILCYFLEYIKMKTNIGLDSKWSQTLHGIQLQYVEALIPHNLHMSNSYD